MRREDIVKVSGSSAEQQARWRAAAAALGLPLAAYMRLAADRVTDEGAVLPPADVDRLEATLLGLRSGLNGSQLGNNVNQIAHALNADIASGNRPHAAPHEAALASAAADIADLKERIAEALGVVRGLRP